MKEIRILDATGKPFQQSSLNQFPYSRNTGYEGGGLGFGAQLAHWTPDLLTEDAAMLPALDLSNARADDLVRNNGYASGGLRLHIDNIVGHIFKLNWQPAWRKIGWTEEQFLEVKKEVESAWHLYAEDDRCLIDAERKRTFTMLIRAAIAQHFTYGDVMASSEWIARRNPNDYQTAIKMISPKRVRNPANVTNFDHFVRGGIRHGKHGEPLGYYVADIHPMLPISYVSYGYKYVQKETQWGRAKFIHVFDAKEDGQSRGTNTLMSIMSRMHMLNQLQETKLQNVIANAMFAATIESELDSAEAFQFITGGQEVQQQLFNWVQNLQSYHRGANIRMNGIKIPHLMAGEKLNLQRAASADNGFSSFEQSILQYITAGLGVSLEQFTHNFQKSNYSSARAAINEAWRYFMGDRKLIAGRFASNIFSLWLEEAVAKGQIKLPKNINFWQFRTHLTRCEWIGSGRMAIDGVKEAKESVLLIEAGLSTYQKELAKLGEDYIEVFEQQYRETMIRKDKGLPQPSWVKAESIAPEQAENTEQNNSNENNNNG